MSEKTIIFADKLPAMAQGNFFQRAFRLYYDGFRSMTLGRTLWIIILVKLFVIFVVLKIFFFPNHIRQHATEGAEDEYVAKELIDRAPI